MKIDIFKEVDFEEIKRGSTFEADGYLFMVSSVIPSCEVITISVVTEGGSRHILKIDPATGKVCEII